jgi:hypothetical protein
VFAHETKNLSITTKSPVWYTTPNSPPLLNSNAPSGWGVTHDLGNARVAPEWASPSHWRRWRPWRFDCCVAAKSPTKLPRRKYCMFSPPSLNHTKPSIAVVSHDVGNARDASEWASPGHWWRWRPWRFDCCVAAKSPTKLPRRKYCMFSPPSSNHNKPRTAVVTHDGGNARVASERAYSSHWRR